MFFWIVWDLILFQFCRDSRPVSTGAQIWISLQNLSSCFSTHRHSRCSVYFKAHFWPSLLLSIFSNWIIEQKDKDGLDLFEICFFLSRVDGLRMHWGGGKLGRGPLLTNSLAAYKLSCKDTAPLSWYYLLFQEIMKQNIWPVHTTNYFARKRHLFHGIIFLSGRKYYNHRSLAICTRYESTSMCDKLPTSKARLWLKELHVGESFRFHTSH